MPSSGCEGSGAHRDLPSFPTRRSSDLHGKREHVGPGPIASMLVEGHQAAGQGEEGVVAANPDVTTGQDLGAALPDQYGPSEHQRAVAALDAEPLGVGIASVAGAAPAFLVGHLYSPASGGGVLREARRRGASTVPDVVDASASATGSATAGSTAFRARRAVRRRSHRG